jgi:hypothetical protein
LKARAQVTWLPSKEGGRTLLPNGRQYVTISKFPEDGPNWPDGAWSVVINFDSPPFLQGNPSIGEASFLMPTAPHDRLREGHHFELFEGLKKIAVVHMIAAD